MGIEDACRRKGINLLFASLPVDENNRPLEVPHLLKNKTVDGLLLVEVCLDENLAPYTQRWAMKEHWIQEIALADFNLNLSKGYQQTLDILPQQPQLTALFGINDDVASAAIRAARDLGKRVAEDLSI